MLTTSIKERGIKEMVLKLPKLKMGMWKYMEMKSRENGMSIPLQRAAFKLWLVPKKGYNTRKELCLFF